MKLSRQVGVFSGLTPEEIHTLICECGRTSVAEGTLSVIEGSSLSRGDFYVILQGQAEVFKMTGEQSGQALATLGAGEIFGEIGAVGTGNRSASVRTTTKCALLAIDPGIEKRHPAISAKLYRNIAVTLANRLRDTTQLYHEALGGDSDGAPIAARTRPTRSM